jgi:site-specific DNA-adenine methylase
LYPIRNYSVTPISENWAKFLNTVKITNQDYIDIIEMYKDNENGFIYIDPPYLDSYNATYNTYQNKNTDEENNIIDNTKIYIDLLEYLKNCTCKILFSINSNAVTKYLYKDYIKNVYNRSYETTIISKNNKLTKTNKIICNFDI